MADNKEKISFEFEVNKKSAEDAFKEIVNTAELFYLKLINLDEEYKQHLKRNIKGQISQRKELNKELSTSRKKTKELNKIAGGTKGGVSSVQAVDPGLEKRAVAALKRTFAKKEKEEKDVANEARRIRHKQKREKIKELRDQTEWRQEGFYGTKPFASKIAASLGVGRITKSPIASAGAEIIDKTVGSSLTNFGKSISETADKSSILGKSLSGLGSAFQMLGGAIGTTIATVLTVLYEATQTNKEYNRKLIQGVGTTGGVNLDKLNRMTLGYAAGQHPLAAVGGGNLKVTIDETVKLTNALMQQGVSLKSLHGNYEDLNAATQVAQVTAINLGMSFEEAGKMMADYHNRTGAGVARMSHVFTEITKDIQNSTMTTNQFLSTMQSVSSQFSVFLDQTAEFSKILSKVSAAGASQAQAAKMTAALAGFGAKDYETGNVMAAFIGKDEYKKEVDRQYKEVSERYERMRSGKDPFDQGKFTELGYRMRSLEAEKEGAGLMGDAFQDMPRLKQMQVILKKMGVTDVKSLRELTKNRKKMEVLSAVTKIGLPDLRNSLDSVGITAAQMGKENLNAVFDAADEGKDTNYDINKANQEAYDSAAELQQKTIGTLKGASETTNVLLNVIAQYAEQIADVLLKTFTGGKVTVKSVLETAQEASKSTLENIIKGMKEGAKQVTQGKVDDKTKKDTRGAAAGYFAHGKAEDLSKIVEEHVKATTETSKDLGRKIDATNAAPIMQSPEIKLPDNIVKILENISGALKTLAEIWVVSKLVGAVGTILNGVKWAVDIGKAMLGISSALPAVEGAVVASTGAVTAATAALGTVGAALSAYAGWSLGKAIEQKIDEITPSGSGFTDMKEQIWAPILEKMYGKVSTPEETQRGLDKIDEQIKRQREAFPPINSPETGAKPLLFGKAGVSPMTQTQTFAAGGGQTANAMPVKLVIRDNVQLDAYLHNFNFNKEKTG